jgi:gentisate 1,2-dioxygenase
MEPLIGRAVREVGMQDAERRVLLLTHPAFQGAAVTTTNLSSGLQTLLPGETARAHRHTIQAIRFVMEGFGAVTSVNEHQSHMAEGDLILTPAWTWHEHTHPGSGRVVWFDGLDLPLCAHLDSMFFELAQPPAGSVEPPPTRPPAWRGEAVCLAPDAFDLRNPSDSRFRYAWERALEALVGAPARADGSRLLRYVDGESRGAVAPTLDCYLLACAQGVPTRPYRSTSNAVCVVARGEGSSQVGGATIQWKRNDVFTLPHWNRVSHTAGSDDAVIFLMTDRELLASLGYLRDEEFTA